MDTLQQSCECYKSTTDLILTRYDESLNVCLEHHMEAKQDKWTRVQTPRKED